MSTSIILYINHIVTKNEEFPMLIEQAGGFMTPEKYIGDAQISDQQGDIYISYIENNSDADPEYENQKDKSGLTILERLHIALGGEYQAWFFINVGHASGSYALAIKFAWFCCQRWPCAIDDMHGRIYSFEEIKQLYEQGEP